MKPSRAAAIRWLAEHVGETLVTVQVSGRTGGTWEPGPRILQRTGNRFTLDGSTISFTPFHAVTGIDPSQITITWSNESTIIHTTTYRIAEPTV